MTNFTALFNNTRSLTFPALTLFSARQLANAYGVKNGLTVRSVKVR
ncbi:hypothetical protein S14_215 [Shewanella sp. phage 1/4]|nr:hypothetical protein S14_215 [Shewanella sp. phage 1/4]AHK11324.1 hypothetical protein S14_215 [Shewanella sp. phage 1/4]